MKKRFKAELLRKLRNEIPLSLLLQDFLDLPTKEVEDFLRFLCPLCSEFNTAVNPKTNLGRCFRCGKNFNTIDMVMLVKGYSFVEAVKYLNSLL